MAVDPNDWWEGRSWLRQAERNHRNPREINREVITRWLASVALCLCFAALAPSEHLGLTFAALLAIASFASAAVALIRQETFYSEHLTAWDEAVWSLAAALALGLWNTPMG